MINLKSFVFGRIKSVKYAFIGLYRLVSQEHSIITQLFIAGLATIAGFYFKISNTEWMMQIFSIGLVLSMEGLNTAIEEMADFIHPDFHKKIGLIKDVAAGAVTISALTAIIIGIIIYYPKLF
ncbi:diacylglycerol kinase family protein [Flavobacterium sp. NKUCC04_CG]|uniref:diacylglycerol kinase family protein n=1 Tax=Flavobacterium sp. NKUCC04_CG TaxID=2842121 RepID=UPI001C5B1455|nr:diacylglycerol kinase family protein [Flavobacterium sp. NKUCC04_CG]MBW3518643.1 diacylglycerol kinase family protein [Flavobacterium sp. NKUCC04_CG]